MKPKRRPDAQTPFPLPCCGSCRWYHPILDDCLVDQGADSMVSRRKDCPKWEEGK